MAGNEIAVYQQQPGAGAVALRDYKPKSLIELAQSAAVMKRLLDGIMKDGVHYGTIPGTPKPTLYQPGADKILSTFMISAEPIVETLETMTTGDCFHYRVKVVGRMPDGTIIGYGIGEASTNEEKYKWRAAVCDEEFDDTPVDRRRIKWAKGYQGGAPKQTKQVRTNAADLSNTALKMAAKRGKIAMVLTATAASDLLTQDLEDLKDIIDITEYEKPTGGPGKGKPEVTNPTEAGTGNQGTTTGSKYAAGDKVKPGGAALVRKVLGENNVTEREFCVYMNIPSVDDLLSGEMTRGMNAIKKGEIPALAEQ